MIRRLSYARNGYHESVAMLRISFRPARLISIVGILVAVLAGPPLAQGMIDPLPPQTTEAVYSGSLLYLNQGSIWQLDLASLSRQPLVQEPGAIITHVSHSWDRQRIAYSAYTRGARFEILQSRIVIAGADGSNPATAVQET